MRGGDEAHATRALTNSHPPHARHTYRAAQSLAPATRDMSIIPIPRSQRRLYANEAIAYPTSLPDEH